MLLRGRVSEEPAPPIVAIASAVKADESRLNEARDPIISGFSSRFQVAVYVQSSRMKILTSIIGPRLIFISQKAAEQRPTDIAAVDCHLAAFPKLPLMTHDMMRRRGGGGGAYI